MQTEKQQVRWRLLILTMILMLSLVFAPAAALCSTGFLPTKMYQGVTYEARPPSEMTTILLIGYDHMDQGDVTVQQTGNINGGQADFLLLILLDHENEQVRRLQIDRDTMTSVKLYGALGNYLGHRKLQICLAHAYGDTQEKNNANTIWAVENLLQIAEEKDGVQIDWYMTMDISGISRLNELLGGVTVPINDDFSHYDETMVQGTTMRLTGKQAEYYCRARYHIGEQSNRSRMVRQRTFMSAAGDLLISRVRKDVNYPRRLLNDMGVIFDTSKALDDGFGFSTSDYKGTPITESSTHYLMTNETLDVIVAQIAKAIDYELVDIETLPGQHTIGSDGYVQYILDDGAAEEWAMNAFYRPVE